MGLAEQCLIAILDMSRALLRTDNSDNSDNSESPTLQGIDSGGDNALSLATGAASTC